MIPYCYGATDLLMLPFFKKNILEQNSKVNVDLYHSGIVYAFSVSYCDHVIVCPFVCLSSDLL